MFTIEESYAKFIVLPSHPMTDWCGKNIMSVNNIKVLVNIGISSELFTLFDGV